MIPLRRRIKLWLKIAQQTGTAATSQPSTSTTNTTTTSVTPAPAFNPVSGPWAWITSAYNIPTVGYLSYLLNMVHVSLHNATSGQFNLLKNQNDLASIDPSGASSVDAKNLILLAQLFNKTFLNLGKPFSQPPTAAQINGWADAIIGSQPLLNLSQMNPTGPIAQQLRLDGSLRQNLINYLNYVKQYNPIQQQQRR